MTQCLAENEKAHICFGRDVQRKFELLPIEIVLKTN